MELYNLKRGDKFKLLEDPAIPPAARDGDTSYVYELKNLDGMYSYVTDKYGRVYHFAAWTEVEKVDEAGKQVP